MAKEVTRKALKAFLHAAASYLVAALSTGVDFFEADVAGGILIGAVAAGLSASWNGVIQPMLNKMKGSDANE
jgi:hypothetical protein